MSVGRPRSRSVTPLLLEIDEVCALVKDATSGKTSLVDEFDENALRSREVQEETASVSTSLVNEC